MYRHAQIYIYYTCTCTYIYIHPGESPPSNVCPLLRAQELDLLARVDYDDQFHRQRRRLLSRLPLEQESLHLGEANCHYSQQYCGTTLGQPVQYEL